jgi:hypothetical protein
LGDAAIVARVESDESHLVVAAAGTLQFKDGAVLAVRTAAAADAEEVARRVPNYATYRSRAAGMTAKAHHDAFGEATPGRRQCEHGPIPAFAATLGRSVEDTVVARRQARVRTAPVRRSAKRVDDVLSVSA